MVASSLALVLSLATFGVGGGVARVDSLAGLVVGPDGRAVIGAEVLATSGGVDDHPVDLLGQTRSDGEGKFVLRLTGAISTCDQPMLWVVAPGWLVGSRPIDHRIADGDPVSIRLDRSSRAGFVVAGPDGRPIPGARVIPRSVAREGGLIPAAVAQLASSTTDRAGRAVVEGFWPEELLSVTVDAPGFGIQLREFRTSDGLATVEDKAITLLASGRVAGRVVADDPRAVAALTVRVESSVGREGRGAGFAEVQTDAQGHFEVPAIASGPLTIRVRPRQGSPDLPARVIRRKLEAGQSVEVEIPLRRGVRVSGIAVDSRDGQPIAGVEVSVVPSSPVEPIRVTTDDQGRYEAFVPAGLVSHRIVKVPAPYLCPPSFLGPRPVEVPPAIARFELPTIALQRGGNLIGRVIDSRGQPVGAARVEASWTMIDGRVRAPRVESTTSKADGTFQLHPVSTDAELSVTASIGEAGTLRPTLARAANSKPIELTVVEPADQPATGLVVSAEGQPIAGASVRIWSFTHTPGGSINGVHLVRLGDFSECLTDSAGRFQTPGPLRGDRSYRAFASTKKFLACQGRSIRPASTGPTSFPDLVLCAEGGRVVVEGRIVDRSGQPLAHVDVQTSAEGPCRHRGVTDENGRFRILGVPEGRRFLFAEKPGFRFFGREIEANGSAIDLTLTRLDEPSLTSMTTQAIATEGIGLARRVLAPYADKVLTEGDQSTRIRTLELLARVDPRRVLPLIEGRIVVDAWLIDHLRHAASCSPATEAGAERRAIVDSIRDAEWRVAGEIDAADALPGTAKAWKREWVERALADARGIADPSRRVVGLAKVADRLIDLGLTERATQLLDEGRLIANSLATTTSGGRARVEFAETLARVDPAGALALTDGLVDPGAFDRCRVKMARRLADRDPAQAARILETLRDSRSLIPAIPALCHALAPIDPAQARRLLNRANGDDPCLASYALGLMALAVADRDKNAATAWLREAFDRLAQVAAGSVGPVGSRDPAAVASALLPVAERIDPTLVPECFWRAVSFQAPRPGSEIRTDAVLALFLARYDHQVAHHILDPLADRALTATESDLDSLIAALAILDPFRAVRLVEQLPEPADLTYHRAKNQARLHLAAALLRGAPACWEDATRRFLHLATEDSPDEN